MKHPKHSAGFVLYHRPAHEKPRGGRGTFIRAASLFVAAACLTLSVTVYPASAATSMSSLQNKLNKLSQSIEQHKKELSNAKKKEAAAKQLESDLKEKVTVIQGQIGVLKSQIADVQNSIGVKQQEITAKEAEIAAKEAEIADQWDGFKQHMAAMQELRDGGSVAMLASVNDLYELLTFNEVMQDISIKDTEILNNMKNAKEALQNDKATLEEERTQLQSKKAELDAQNSQMQSKQNELNSSVREAQLSAAEAQKAQQDAKAAIESDEMNYEAVKKEIQKLIAAAAAAQPQLSFTGFICPLKSYTRISSEYGWRKNPVSGVNKLHAGTDFAAPRGRPSMRPPAAMCRWLAGPAAAMATMSSSITAKCRTVWLTVRCTAICARWPPRRASMSSRVRSSVMWAALAIPRATTSTWKCGAAVPRRMRSTPAVISP